MSWSSDDDYGDDDYGTDVYGDDYDDEYDDGISETRPCPNCRAEIYEQATVCPECGELIDWTCRSSSAFAGRPVWWVILGGIGVVATIVALVGL